MKIGIVGLGYVGLPLAVAFSEAGNEVVGLDTDARKVEAIAEGRSYIEDVPDSALAPLAERFRATADYSDLGACDAVVICVPTPLTSAREPDLASACCRYSRSRAFPRAPTSISPSRRSESTRVARTTRSARPRSWSAGSPRVARSEPGSCTR
jgi:hypothetical protein